MSIRVFCLFLHFRFSVSSFQVACYFILGCLFLHFRLCLSVSSFLLWSVRVFIPLWLIFRPKSSKNSSRSTKVYRHITSTSPGYRHITLASPQFKRDLLLWLSKHCNCNGRGLKPHSRTFCTFDTVCHCSVVRRSILLVVCWSGPVVSVGGNKGKIFFCQKAVFHRFSTPNVH